MLILPENFTLVEILEWLFDIELLHMYNYENEDMKKLLILFLAIVLVGTVADAQIPKEDMLDSRYLWVKSSVIPFTLDTLTDENGDPVVYNWSRFDFVVVYGGNADSLYEMEYDDSYFYFRPEWMTDKPYETAYWQEAKRSVSYNSVYGALYDLCRGSFFQEQSDIRGQIAKMMSMIKENGLAGDEIEKISDSYQIAIIIAKYEHFARTGTVLSDIAAVESVPQSLK